MFIECVLLVCRVQGIVEDIKYAGELSNWLEEKAFTCERVEEHKWSCLVSQTSAVGDNT